MRKNVLLLGLLVLFTACEQTPARVEDNGKKTYDKRSMMVAAASLANDPRYEPAASAPSVAVQSIESKDLMAPAAKASNSMFKMPVEGKIISRFGQPDNGGKNDGINIAAPAGTPVRASASGSVVFVGDQLRTYGNMVIIKHEGRRNTTYAHLGKTFVSKGQQVAQGDAIGTVGKTGQVAIPQLHFALREGATPEDPMHYMPTMRSSL